MKTQYSQKKKKKKSCHWLATPFYNFTDGETGDKNIMGGTEERQVS